MPTHQGAGEELRGSAPVMSARDLLLEVYHDMKFVRPALEGLLAAGLVARVEALERDHIARDERGGAPLEIVHRVNSLEDWKSDVDAAGVERRRIGDISGRTLATLILVSNFVLGMVVMFVNLIGAAN